MNIRLVFISLTAFAASAVAQTSNKAVMVNGSQAVHDTKTFDGVVVSGSGSLVTQPGATIRIGNIQLTWEGIPATASIEGDDNKHGLIVHTSGAQGIPIVAWTETGLPAIHAAQTAHYNSPVIVATRDIGSGNQDNPVTGEIYSCPILYIKDKGGTARLAHFISGEPMQFEMWIDHRAQPHSNSAVLLQTPGDPNAGSYNTGSLVLYASSLDNRLHVSGASGDYPLSGEVLFAPKATAPANPVPGQCYFNTNDHHFYGWDGTAWKQIDN